MFFFFHLQLPLVTEGEISSRKETSTSMRERGNVKSQYFFMFFDYRTINRRVSFVFFYANTERENQIDESSSYYLNRSSDNCYRLSMISTMISNGFLLYPVNWIWHRCLLTAAHHFLSTSVDILHKVASEVSLHYIKSSLFFLHSIEYLSERFSLPKSAEYPNLISTGVPSRERKMTNLSHMTRPSA